MVKQMTAKDVYRSFQKVRETRYLSFLIISISATAHLTTLQNRYTVLKMQTRIMQTQQLLGFSRFPSQHLEES